MAFLESLDLPFLHPGHSNRLEHRLSRVSDDVEHVARLLRRLGGEAGSEAGSLVRHTAGSALRHGAAAAGVLRMTAKGAGRAIGRDPVPVLVALAGIACFARLLMGRRGRTRS